MTNATLRGKPDAGNPNVRFDEGEVASVNPRRGSLCYKSIITVSVSAIAFAAVAKPGDALLQMRLRADDTRTYEVWQSNLCAIAEHPGCCDEVWFSTSMGAPTIAWHRAQAPVVIRAAEDLRKIGIVPSLQFQATIGHGDMFKNREPFGAKNWNGWTDSKGVETRTCNCPRQAAFLAYLAEVSRLYAPAGFKAVWIDDDLRYNNHLPADNRKLVGCWCETCLREFNAANKTSYTREALAKAVETDTGLAARWRKFSIDSLCGVARTIAETFHAESPSTMMAQQQGSWPDAAESAVALVDTLHAASGHPVGYRPGAGAYHDFNPNLQVEKSISAGTFRKLMGNPAYVCEWTCEIESAPRTYYSRSAQSVLIEGFVALMFGMNRISYFISNSSKESPALYAEHFWKPLADAAPVLRGYAGAIDGCMAIGCSAVGGADLRRAGIPVLSGIGYARGACPDAKKSVEDFTTREIQAFREEADARCGGLPALLKSPFYGMMLPYVDTRGHLKVVALVNLRIEPQQNLRIVLRNLPADATTAVWHELRRPDRTLAFVREGDETSVTMPDIAAWNAGYLDFK